MDLLLDSYLRRQRFLANLRAVAMVKALDIALGGGKKQQDPMKALKAAGFKVPD